MHFAYLRQPKIYEIYSTLPSPGGGVASNAFLLIPCESTLTVTRQNFFYQFCRFSLTIFATSYAQIFGGFVVSYPLPGISNFSTIFNRVQYPVGICLCSDKLSSNLKYRMIYLIHLLDSNRCTSKKEQILCKLYRFIEN